MPWVKLDDQFFSHPKVLRAGRDARDLYLASLTFCARSRTDGVVPSEALRQLAAMADIDGPEGAVERLLKERLWEPTDKGWVVHDYLDYNPTREKIEEVREARAEAGARGGLASAAARAEAKAKQSACPVAVGDGSDGGKQNPTPSSSSSSSSDPSTSSESRATARRRAPPGNGDKRPRTPEERQRDAVRTALRKHFTERTGIQIPEATTERQRKELAALWWEPLRQIAAKANWDVQAGRGIIDRALERLNDPQLNLTDPNSIRKVALALADQDANGTSDDAEQVAQFLRAKEEADWRLGLKPQESSP